MVSLSKNSEAKACSCESIKQQEEELETAALALCNKCALDLDKTAHRVWRALRKEYIEKKDATSALAYTLKEHLEALLEALEFHDKSGCCEEHKEQGDTRDETVQERRCAQGSLWLAINERAQWRLQMTKDEASKYGYEVVNEGEVQEMVNYIRKVRLDSRSKCEPRDEKSSGECDERMDIATQTSVGGHKDPPSSPVST